MPDPKKKYPSALFWIDVETTGLPDGNDFSGVEIIEVGVIVTDFNLKPYFGYQGVVQMNDKIKKALSNNPDVVQMHLESGLLKDSKESTDSLEVIESEILNLLKTKSTQEKGEYLIAGSGVAAFDFPLLKEKLPELASWFSYAPFDIGIQRRVAYYLSNRRDVVSPTQESFKEGVKKHRAMDDVKAHLLEANEWRKFYNWAVEQQTKGS